MKRNAYRAILLSLALVLSSLAGCLSADEDDDEIIDTVEIIGTVMVST